MSVKIKFSGLLSDKASFGCCQNTDLTCRHVAMLLLQTLNILVSLNRLFLEMSSIMILNFRTYNRVNSANQDQTTTPFSSFADYTVV